MDAAERFGVVNAILLMLGLGVAVCIAVRGPELIKALNGTLTVILTYRKEKKRIDQKVKDRQAALQKDTHLALERKKRKSTAKVKGVQP